MSPRNETRARQVRGINGRMASRGLIHLLLALLVFGYACSNEEVENVIEEDCPAYAPSNPSGSLMINVAGAPSTPTIEVEDFVGTRWLVNGSTTITDLPGSLYTVAAQTVTVEPVGDALAGRVFTIAPNSVQLVCVRFGETTVLDLEYVEHPASGKLWVAQGPIAANDVVAFDEEELRASGSVAPVLGLDLFERNDSNNVVGLGFDAWGNLWLGTASASGNRFHALTPGQLGSGGTVRPALTLDALSLTSLGSMTLVDGRRLYATDPAGNALWTENTGAATWRAFYVADGVLRSGGVVFDELVSGTLGAVARDRAGEVWVSDTTNDTVSRLVPFTDTEGLPRYRFEPVLIGNTPPPVVNTLSAPNAMVFLPSGDLWVSYLGSNVLARYSAAEVGASGTYEPNPQVTIPVTAVPAGLAVDARGGVWSAQFEERLQRVGSGPYTVTSTSLADPTALTFYPAP